MKAAGRVAGTRISCWQASPIAIWNMRSPGSVLPGCWSLHPASTSSENDHCRPAHLELFMKIAKACRILLAVCAFCLPLTVADLGVAGEQKSDLSQIIETLKSLSKKEGQAPEEQSSFADIERKVGSLELKDNSEEREKL